MKDVKKMSIKEQARHELAEEQRKNAKDKLKKKLRQLRDAKQVVANIEREIDELELEIEHAADV